MTTRYNDGGIESLLSSLHEFGHALYERQIDPELDRTNLGTGTSMSIHESQSKLWENHIARHPAFAEVLAARARRRPAIEIGAAELHAALVAVEPSLIRVSADPLTYPLHIVLRFELELALIDGDLGSRRSARRVAGRGAPAAGARGPHRRARLPAGRALERGRFRLLPELCDGLSDRGLAVGGDGARARPPRARISRARRSGRSRTGWRRNVHRYGRRLDTVPVVEQATGQGLEVESFLRYVSPFAAV